MTEACCLADGFRLRMINLKHIKSTPLGEIVIRIPAGDP
jgi:hypothetical protein